MIILVKRVSKFSMECHIVIVIASFDIGPVGVPGVNEKNRLAAALSLS